MRTAIASTSMFGTRYGPLAWPAMRSRTFIPTLAYAPESPMARTCNAVSLPCLSHEALYFIVIGCRLACIKRLSSRESVHFTGVCNSQALKAVWAWLLMSSLPPNAPPFVMSSTVTFELSRLSNLAMSLRSSQIPCPPEYTCRDFPSAAGTATVLSGSRNACSIR